MIRKTTTKFRAAMAAGAASALVTGCGASVVDGTDPAVRQSAPAEVGLPDQPGVAREGTFLTSEGLQRLRYLDVNGRRLLEGDILLGASEEERARADQSTLSAGRSAATFRWPGNVIPFTIQADMPASMVTLINNAIAHWTATTSIRFVARTDQHNDWVEFGNDGTGCFSSVGRQGGLQTVNLASSCNQGNAIHEIGHAVGLWHEQSRSDRDAYLSIDLDCVDTNPNDLRPQFGSYTNGADYGLYDFQSVMHYGSTFFLDDATPAASPAWPNCQNQLYTQWRRSSAPGTHDVVTAQRGELSFIDRQGVEEMYSRGFGQALTTGDFNDDGFADVAIGAPREGSNEGGHVYVFRGSAAGLTLDSDLGQGIAGASGDRFGAALASADFNDDGVDDLAIGVPGENLSTGRVVIYRGRAQATNIVARDTDFNQSRDSLGAPETNDRFGFALTAGDLDGDGDGDLAVGAPGEAWGASTPASGAVFIYHGGSGGLAGSERIGQSGLGSEEPGDFFGASLANTDFDGDGDDDLVVGAPHERFGSDPNSGVVFVFNGGATLSGLKVLRPIVGATNYAAWDMSFGFSLATGDFNGDGRRDLAVGAPGEEFVFNFQAGRVFVFHGATTGLGGTSGQASYTLSSPSVTTDMAFGFSLSAGKFDSDGYTDLAIGVAAGDGATGVASGRVRVYRGRSNSTSLVSTYALTQGAASTNEAGDRLGAAVAFLDYNNDGRADLIAGAPGEMISNASVGRAYVYRATGTSLPTTPTLTLSP